jgi:hypothetical protein
MKKHMAIIKIGHIHHNEKLENSGPNICITSFFNHIDGWRGKKDTHQEENLDLINGL